MDRKRTAVIASTAMVLIAGWMPLITATVVVGGGAMLVGCAGSSERSDTRQDTRVETRTEDRVKDRRD